jgi:hypothetical protein
MHGGADYEVRAASSDDDLRRILELQAANLPVAITPEELAREGFVTLRHDLPLLRDISGGWGHVVASPRGSAEIAGYALVMQREFRPRIPELEPMFARLDGFVLRGRPIDSMRWYMMGQLCVGKGHRGHGLVERLYAGHRALMSDDFDLVVTLIDKANPRSVRVHERVGFETIDAFRTDDGREWVTVAMGLGALDSSDR